MSTPARYFPSPAPKSLAQLTRAQVAARVAVVREAIDMMATQANMDGGAVIECLGAAKVALYHLERHLQDRDRQERAQELSAFARDLLRAPLEVQLAAVRQSAEG